MPYPPNKILPDTDRHAKVTKNLRLAKERTRFQANKRRSQPTRWKSGQKVMFLSDTIDLPNVNKKMKPRWLRPFPMTQVHYQRNKCTLDLTSNSDLRYIYKTFHIRILKPYCENNQHEVPQRHHSETGPIKGDTCEVEKAVNFRFSHPAREPLYQSR